METPAQLFPLTDEQLAEWRKRIHDKYIFAEDALEDARRHERLYRRYSKRHIAMMDRKARADVAKPS